MNNKLNLFLPALLIILFLSTNTFSQTEGFNVKSPIQKIADSTSNFLTEIVDESKKQPKRTIPQELVCSSKCYLVIPQIDVVPSRGDFTGTGLMTCRTPDSSKLTEPLYYKINHLDSFEESEGGLVILATDTDGMKSILAEDVNLSSENSSSGPIGSAGDVKMKSFATYVKYKDQTLSGIDLSGSLLEYSGRDTFNAYQGTIVPIEILINPQDVPPMLRDFNTLVLEWAKSCK